MSRPDISSIQPQWPAESLPTSQVKIMTEVETQASTHTERHMQIQTPAATRLQSRLKRFVANSDFDGHLDLHNSITLHDAISSSAGNSKTLASFAVSRVHTNRFRNLHGACAAAILEAGCLSALAAAARPDFWETLGVGRSLRVVYLATAHEGERCWVESEVVKAGKRMCKSRLTWSLA